MMIWTARVSMRKIIIAVLILASLTSILILSICHSSPSPGLPPLETNNQRVAYLQSLGWEVSPEPMETLQFLMPETLEEPYVTYNKLQQAQGFDLSACCGKQVTRYTYAVLNHPDQTEGIQANLFVCDGIPVAGDIFCSGENGFQLPLIPAEAPPS
jgi:hypothetical protein